MARAGALKVDVFIDDLPEILEHPGFPAGARGILFDPEDRWGATTVRAASRLGVDLSRVARDSHGRGGAPQAGGRPLRQGGAGGCGCAGSAAGGKTTGCSGLRSRTQALSSSRAISTTRATHATGWKPSGRFSTTPGPSVCTTYRARSRPISASMPGSNSSAGGAQAGVDRGGVAPCR